MQIKTIEGLGVGGEVKDFSLLNGTLTWLKYKLEDNETVTDLKVC